jgi:2-polyprenyl-3-methyl-5-hydroxy-6-metoxy-1,4-benzoquinol methylase
MKILDTGCGSGRDTKSFLELGYRVEAFDASKEMVRRASEYTGMNLELKTFDDITNHYSFDGIWFCASLLHVPLKDLVNTFETLSNAPKKEGITYVSFKHGHFERESGGRFFTDLNEDSLNSIIKQTSNLSLAEFWITTDQRLNREEQWINALLKQKP